ncbi:hypothetical protein SRHO_G00042150 [Serrasalmus rhombeus]
MSTLSFLKPYKQNGLSLLSYYSNPGAAERLNRTVSACEVRGHVLQETQRPQSQCSVTNCGEHIISPAD